MQSTDVQTVPACVVRVETSPAAGAEEIGSETAEAEARLQRAAGILARAAIRVATQSRAGGEAQTAD
jgi:hypothetical protein